MVVVSKSVSQCGRSTSFSDRATATTTTFAGNIGLDRNIGDYFTMTTGNDGLPPYPDGTIPNHPIMRRLRLGDRVRCQ